ncbi:probable ATP-dependent RNA helicase DDX31 isoform X1 [Lingula anatina]|uniref:ATP-dependent RNA helicase n=1 Tax=Lingula anatina TaxID=7574 RepID=A0A1S3JXN5_LINAN|nr:probable ATP-dependent RNA helicase DDX31 isoform X1 [Lingula anatina]|eukprot:XP_013415138.1 probable ATP-dependent RNA helicase DDX31 isoform X1 [Lingula anatina]
MDQADDGLLLNLVSFGGEGGGNKRPKKEDKLTRLKRQRAEKRRALISSKIAASKQETPTGAKKPKLGTNGPTIEEDKHSPSPAEKERKIPSETESAHEKGKNFRSGPQQIVASLFRNNPEIPKVSSHAVEQLKEKIFSSDKFSELQLHPFLVTYLEEKMGLCHMTSIQQKSIPQIISGHDTLVKSQTGSGKTLAFAIPVVQHLQSIVPKIQRQDGPYAIVIVPTRELALQSLAIFQKLVQPFHWIVPGCLMGGERKKSEKARLRKGINILVSTPGRLIDHVQNTEALGLTKVKWLIIDEADRLLDMGFERDVAQIVNSLNEKQEGHRQTVLLSATLSQGVERLAGMSLVNPQLVEVSKPVTDTKVSKPDSVTVTQTTDDKFVIPEHLQQHFIVVPSKLRLVTLAAFILQKCKYAAENNKMVVFMATQDSTEFHHSLLVNTIASFKEEEEEEGDERDIEIFKLHGDMVQKERTQVFQDFSSTRSGVLLCTDVAARGLDLPKVKWIVQYNTPGTPTEYIHRVGRTARAGTRGSSLLFLSPSEVDYVQVLNDHKISMEEVSMKEVLQTLMVLSQELAEGRKSKGRHPHSVEESATVLQNRFETYLYQNKERIQLAKKAYQSFLRSYATYPSNLKHIFHMKNLHLGHVAKSFGLREAPKQISQFKDNKYAVKLQRKTERREQLHKEASLPHKRVNMSEYASGLDVVKTVKKRKARNKKAGKTKKRK